MSNTLRILLSCSLILLLYYITIVNLIPDNKTSLFIVSVFVASFIISFILYCMVLLCYLKFYTKVKDFDVLWTIRRYIILLGWVFIGSFAVILFREVVIDFNFLALLIPPIYLIGMHCAIFYRVLFPIVPINDHNDFITPLFSLLGYKLNDEYNCRIKK